MNRLFNRPKNDVVSDHRQDAKVVATEARIAELAEIIRQAGLRAESHDPAIEAAARVVERAELNVLANVGTDADLAVAQAAHLAARREKALDLIAKEQAAEELAKLEKALPGLREKAMRASQKALRARYMTIATELAAALEQAVQLDARLAALYDDASQQFGYNAADANVDRRTFPERAGIVRPIKTTLVNGQYGWVAISGQAQDWLNYMRAGIEQVKKLQKDLD